MSGKKDKNYYEEEYDDDEEEEDRKCSPNLEVSRSNPNEGHKKGGATLFYDEEREDTKRPPQQVPWPKENEERADHKPGKHHKRTHKHHKHRHKHHKHEHIKQPSMESSDHQKAHREFAEKDKETIEMEEGVFGAEWEKFDKATDGHLPGSDPNEQRVSMEARNAAHGSSGGRHAVPSLRGTDASPGAEAVDGRVHPSNTTQRRTHTLPPTRPGAVRVPGPDNEGLVEDDEQTTVVSHEEPTIPFVPEAERVDTEEDERRRQAAINQGIDNFIATAPVADVVPDNRGRRQKLAGAFLLVVIMIAIVIGAVLVIKQRPKTISPLRSGVEISRVASDKGEALRNSSTPQYKAFSWTVTNNEASSNEEIFQHYALATLFYSTNRKSWNISTGWLSNEGECFWYGLNCTNSATPGAVSKLSLSENNLYGTIPPEMELMSELEGLDLDSNALEGTIPSELCQLKKLTFLDLSDNNLTGTIPSEVGMLSDSLKYLDLDTNALEGAIPSEIWQLTKLTYLDLWGNDGITGVIPSEIGILSDSLEVLRLSLTKLVGTIPSEIGLLTNLTSLYLRNNELTGTIPSEINSLDKLVELHLDGNKFTGTYTCPYFIVDCAISCDDLKNEVCRSL